MYCHSCGKSVEQTARFCSLCGAALRTQEGVTPPPGPTQQAQSLDRGRGNVQKGFRTLDWILSVLLVGVFVPLSLWGGSTRWTGDTDFLPFIMFAVGAVFVILESIRLCSPVIGALLGALVPVTTLLPSFFMYHPGRGDVAAFKVSIIVGLLFGLAASTICWLIKRSSRP